MRSISWKLAGALLLIVVITVGLMAYFANINATSGFSQYIAQGNQKNIQNTSALLGQFYSLKGDWNNLQSTLSDLLHSPNDRLVVADVSGIIVGDTASQWLGKKADSVGLVSGTSITASGQNVGEVFLVTKQTGNGKGNMGGKGNSTATMPMDVTSEQLFLDKFNNSLLITGLIVAALALILGFLLTYQITRPLKVLVNGVRQITKGNLGHRVNIKSKDELNDLGQSFNTMAAGLDNAEQERKRIIADIAHDLRTPLTVIEGTVTAIQDGVFKPDKERMDAIKEQTSLLTRLTSDLRDISLVDSGQLKLMKAPTDLVELVRRKAAQFEIKAREKGIKISTILPGESISVNIDPTRIEQVLGNLITNAIRYTSAGSITISLRQVDQDTAHQVTKPCFILSVADTGEGIAPEHLLHVFERFYRVEKSRVRNEGGSGLGLAIVKQMVQAHGGKVWVESVVGKGSTFYFSLPL
jgi:signal transduction histidine kinase